MACTNAGPSRLYGGVEVLSETAGSGDVREPPLVDQLMRNYSIYTRRVLRSFAALGNTHVWYANESSPNDEESGEDVCATFIRNKVGSGLLKVDPAGCLTKLQCSHDNSRFPPLIINGKCVHNYRYDPILKKLYTCRATWKRIFTLQHTNISPVTNRPQSTKLWRLKSSTIAGDCLCITPDHTP